MTIQATGAPLHQRGERFDVDIDITESGTTVSGSGHEKDNTTSVTIMDRCTVVVMMRETVMMMRRDITYVQDDEGNQDKDLKPRTVTTGCMYKK